MGPAVRRNSPELGPDPAFLESTTRHSAGNPLFAEHLVLRGDPGDDRLPATLHEPLDARVRALPEATHSVLRAAAVLRRPVTPALLAATAGTGVGAVETAVRPAIEQHVLALRPDDTLAFRYPAFAEVVYAALLPGERAALHRAAAVALEADVATGRGGPARRRRRRARPALARRRGHSKGACADFTRGRRWLSSRRRRASCWPGSTPAWPLSERRGHAWTTRRRPGLAARRG